MLKRLLTYGKFTVNDSFYIARISSVIVQFFTQTYVDPADYDVLRVWTRGLHPAGLYPLDRSLRHRPKDSASSPTEEDNSPTIRSRLASLNRWLERLTNLVGPKPLPLVPSDYLCYGHVLLSYRLKGDNSLCLRMLKVSSTNSRSRKLSYYSFPFSMFQFLQQPVVISLPRVLLMCFQCIDS